MPLEPGTFKRIIELLGDPELLITDLLAVPTDIIEQVQKLEQLYADTKPEVRERVSQQIERGQVANTVKELNNYKCQVCEELGMDPIGFKTGWHYVCGSPPRYASSSSHKRCPWSIKYHHCLRQSPSAVALRTGKTV